MIQASVARLDRWRAITNRPRLLYPKAVQNRDRQRFGYTADDMRLFAVAIGLKPLTTPVCSPQSNGISDAATTLMNRAPIRTRACSERGGKAEPSFVIRGTS